MVLSELQVLWAMPLIPQMFGSDVGKKVLLVYGVFFIKGVENWDPQNTRSFSLIGQILDDLGVHP